MIRQETSRLQTLILILGGIAAEEKVGLSWSIWPICDLDLTELQPIQPPRGFGRD
jgi:hypothetical protein